MRLQKTLLISSCFVIFSVLAAHAQRYPYRFIAPMRVVGNDGWCRVPLRAEILEKMDPSMGDVRILQIAGSDTTEVPYVLRSSAPQQTTKAISFSQINTSHNTNGYYYTFEIPSEVQLNEINLQLGASNFDWVVRLDGSDDRQQWFTMLDGYRIVDIHQGDVAFTMTKLRFPTSKYHYVRLLISTPTDPKLQEASLTDETRSVGSTETYKAVIRSRKELEGQRTEILARLPMRIPASELRINVTSPENYYRPMHVYFLRDSFQVEGVWKYQYEELMQAVLSSKSGTKFQWSTEPLRDLKLVIYNSDNQPLNVEGVFVSAYTYELVAKFPGAGNYSLVFGGDKGAPSYDIVHFADQIPAEVETVLPDPPRVFKQSAPTTPAFSLSRYWVWGAMFVIMAVLGAIARSLLKK